MKERHQEKIWTKNFISVSLTQFILFTVFYALITTLPIFVIVDLNESEAKAGLVATFMLLSAIIIRPFSAKIIDTFGKKKVLLITVIAYLLTTVTYIFVTEFISLSIIRLVHGLSFGIVTTVTGSIVADIIPISRRGEGMGYFSMSNNIAIVIGPFVGLLLIQYMSFRSLFIVSSILMVIAVIFSLLIDAQKLTSPHKTSTTLKLADLIDKNALPIALISALVGIAYGSILSFVPVYAESISLEHVSSYFFLVYAIVMIASRPYLGRMFDRRGPKIVLIPSLIVFAIGLIVLSTTKTVFVFLLAAALIGLGYGTILPGFQTIAVQRAGANRSSQAFSTFFTFYDIGIGLGAFIWGVISASYGFSMMYVLSGVLIAFTVLILYIYLAKKQKQTSE